MNDIIKQQIVEAWHSLPESVKGRTASEDQLLGFEEMYGPVPPDLRWFLLACGGCPVGSNWVDGIEELPNSHKKFADETRTPNGWTMSGVFIVGWDGSGNPYGICKKTGRILVEDHDFGGIHEMASSFEEMLMQGLLKSK